MIEDLQKYKRVLFNAVDESAKILIDNFDTDFKVGRKTHYNDLVTEVDNKSEAKIIEVIHSHFPDHNVLSEEIGNLNLDSDHIWIVDPIDGTVNYAHSIPIFSISIALEIKKEIMLGLIYNPISGEKFFSEKGKGAYLGDKRIAVSNTQHLRDSILVTGFPYGTNEKDDSIVHFANFIKHGLPIRRLGSAALDMCYVACGRFDGFWEVSLNPWDVAAGYLILYESDGRITNFKGEKYSIYGKQLLATNGRIHKEMMDVLEEAGKK